MLGAALLLSLGVAQWLVPRHYVDGAWVGIGANAVAWLVGLAVSVSFMSALITESSSTLTAIAIGAGLLMGGVVAGITGAFLVPLPRRQR